MEAFRIAAARRELVRSCRALIREFDAPRAGLEFWDSAVEAAAQELGRRASELLGLKVEPPTGIRSPLRQTRTMVALGLSQPALEEIARKLKAAGHNHAFSLDAELGETIDLHGICVVAE